MVARPVRLKKAIDTDHNQHQATNIPASDDTTYQQREEDNRQISRRGIGN